MIIPGMLVALLSRELGYRIQSNWAQFALAALGVKLIVKDENEGDYTNPPYVFVALNQSSILEGFVTACCLPKRCATVIDIGYAFAPFLGWMKWILGGIIVVRSNRRQSLRAMEKAERRLRSGENVYISIEGTRTKDGHLGQYKKGPAVIAINSGSTIIPFFYRGMRERLPYGEWRVRPGIVEVTFCSGISTKGLKYDDRDRVVRELRVLAEGRIEQTRGTQV